MAMWQFKWITTWGEVWGQDFISRWCALMKDSPDAHVYFEPTIVRAWYETYFKLRNIEPRFIMASYEGEYEIFFPLVLDKGAWKDGWQNIIYPVGQYGFDYHDPIVNKDLSDDLIRAFWKAFKEEISQLNDRIDVIDIPRIRGRWIDEQNSFLKPVAQAPFIDLLQFKTYEDFLMALPKQLRQELRRQPKRLRERGPLEFKIIKDTNCALEVLPTVEKRRRERWPNANITKGFYHNLVKFGLESGLVHLSVIKSCGEAISWHLGFQYKSKFYYYIPVFNPDMANYSPGKVHLALLIEEAIKQQLEIFDFLLGAENYKLKWTKDCVDLYEYVSKTNGIMAGIRQNSKNLYQSAAAIKRRLYPQ